MPGIGWILLGGFAFSLLWVVLGVRIRYFKSYGLLAGYNTAPAEEQARYDVEGLGNHVGNGLITMGVLFALATGAVGLGSMTWTWVFFGLFLGVVFLIVVGGRKFLPENQHPPGEQPPSEHSFLRRIVPERAFRAIEIGTRHWLIECSCGHIRDYWDAGGVRFKAVGEPRQWTHCPACGEAHWQKVRKKRPGELGGPGGRPAT
ncbi:MAG: DUF3784 domain-containing protein [Deltaproteobacteria bacterium]|nr:DUF3784 domain-containing protein [Deltaproteobacteria bacterium]